MRATTAILLTALVLVLGMMSSSPGVAAQRFEATRASGPLTDLSAQARRRPRVRIERRIDERGVYPSYFPGANAVRDCSVTYAQEFRPSGTVIVPRMRCFWRQP